MEGILQGIEPDYAYYTSTYHGTMGETEFLAQVPDALAEVSYYIWPHSDLMPYKDRIKMAVCAVADAAGNPERRRTSYSAGEVSESYTAGFSLTAEAAVKRWLAGTNLLKRGKWL